MPCRYLIVFEEESVISYVCYCLCVSYGLSFVSLDLGVNLLSFVYVSVASVFVSSCVSVPDFLSKTKGFCRATATMLQ